MGLVTSTAQADHGLLQPNILVVRSCPLSFQLSLDHQDNQQIDRNSFPFSAFSVLSFISLQIL
jgi:hypothetical protein